MSANHNSMQPPTKHFGIYTLTHDKIVITNGDAEIPITLGRTWPEYRVKDGKQNISYSFITDPANGPPRKFRYTADMSDNDLSKNAFEAGVVIRDKQHFSKFIKEALTQDYIQDQEPLELVDSTGWIDDDCKAFNTGVKTICNPEFDITGYHIDLNEKTPYRTKGGLDEWKTNIGVLIQDSKIALVVTCLCISSILLEFFNLSSRLVNLWGGKGKGKTLISQMGATIWGCGIDPARGANSETPPFMRKAESTINAIELMLKSYSPFPLILDELTELRADVLYDCQYKISSGCGKTRSTSNMKEAEANRWQLNVISTSEVSIAETVASGKRPLHGGQRDRAIDIPIDDLGIFSCFEDEKAFADLTIHLKEVTNQFYGTPGEAIIEYIVNHPEVLRELLEHLNEFETFLLPEGCDHGQRRVIKNFAVGLVAGYLASSAGVFSCETDDLDNAFQAVVKVWWEGQTPQCFVSIDDFLSNNINDIFKEAPSRNSRAMAFISDELLIIPAVVFDRVFAPNVTDMLKQLKLHRALRHEQKNRNKSRYCNNRLETYDIHLERITPFLSAELREFLGL